MNTLVKSTTILFIITILSKIVGFGREVALTYVYGASMISDVYIVSVGIPGILFASVGSALATTFIPLFYEVDKISREKSLKFANNVFNIVIIISFIMIVFGFLFTEELVKLFAIDFIGEKLNLAVKFTRIMMLGILFIGLSNIMTSWLQINNDFTIPGMIGFPYNIIIIISIILSEFTNPSVMVFGTLLAMFSQFLFQLPFSKKYGFKYTMYINLKDEYIRKMIFLLGPVFIGVITSQLNAIIDKNLASTLEDGMITVLNSANRLNGFVIGLFIATISSVIYPTLSKLSNDINENKQFSKIISKSINAVILLIVPTSVGSIVLAEPIVRFVFERGAFDSYATKMTAIALACYSIGMIGFGLRDLLSKVFYSIQDTKTPMINGTISIILNIILNIILIKFLGHAGLALATSISALICIVLLLRSLNRKIGYFGQDKIFKTFIKSIFSSVIMGIVSFIVYKIVISFVGISFIGEGISLGVSIFTGVIIYGLLIMLLKVEEVNIILNLFKSKLRKN